MTTFNFTIPQSLTCAWLDALQRSGISLDDALDYFNGNIDNPRRAAMAKDIEQLRTEVVAAMFNQFRKSLDPHAKPVDARLCVRQPWQHPR